MNIHILQIDSRILMEVDGEVLPDIFSGYELKSSSCGEQELWLSVRGTISEAVLSARLSAQLKQGRGGTERIWFFPRLNDVASYGKCTG